jgi:hemoglobin
MKSFVSAVLFGVLLIVAGSTPVAQAADTQKSLYDRIGGQPAVNAVANGLVDRILKDDRVNHWFAHAAASPANTAAYKAQLASFLCTGLGGPCKYTGLDMMAAHRGRGVTNEAFGAVAEDLVAVLDQLKVPAQEKGEVLKIVGSLKPSIVQNTTASK